MSESSVAAAGTSDPSARIKRVPTPVASPGSCVICGKNEHPLGFAATDNLDFEFYGTLYFCADCVGDYARVFGYVSPDDISGLREVVDAQNLELNTLRQAVLGLESTVDGLIADAHRRNSPKRVHDHSVNSRGDSERDAEQGEQSVDDSSLDSAIPVGPSKPSQQRPAEQADKQGRDDLLDTSSADELLGL